jgi:hypothetical protein
MQGGMMNVFLISGKRWENFLCAISVVSINASSLAYSLSIALGLYRFEFMKSSPLQCSEPIFITSPAFVLASVMFAGGFNAIATSIFLSLSSFESLLVMIFLRINFGVIEGIFLLRHNISVFFSLRFSLIVIVVILFPDLIHSLVGLFISVVVPPKSSLSTIMAMFVWLFFLSLCFLLGLVFKKRGLC